MNERQKTARDLGLRTYTTDAAFARQYIVPHLVEVGVDLGPEPSVGVEFEINVGPEPEEGVEMEIVACPAEWFVQ